MKNEMLPGQIASDLAIDAPFVKGKDNPVRNCWHFSTDGNAVNYLFHDEADFKDGMNRVFLVWKKYNVTILAFTLMDTHVHFVLHGAWDECNRFVHEYVRQTSQHLRIRFGEERKLSSVPIHHQEIDTDRYLKTVICYVVKNAPVGGIPFNGFDYPWSSGPLYFREKGSSWAAPLWAGHVQSEVYGTREARVLLKTRHTPGPRLKLIDEIVFPGTYVPYELVEMIFKSHKSYNFFLCRSREDEVDARGGSISLLSIPIQEMRQHKTEICRELFGERTVKKLNTQERLRLAKTLRARYNSSLKQICRLTGLVYEEVRHLL
ncbi:MAG: hypothetical protein IJV01_08150 [Bacteroidales bacterium]|nr:hypothetical protein [Bacteroidales bacterium]